MKQTESNNVESNKKKFGTQLLVAGTAACIADVASFPFDTAKVRLQLQGESSGAIVSRASAITKNFHLPLAISTSNGAFISAEFPVEATHTSNTPQLKQQYRGLFGTISTIVRQEGPRALYNGLSAGLQRQMVFASVRLGMYDSVKSIYQNVIHERPDGFQVLTRVMAGITTGSMAVIVGQPTEVAKVRFQAQKRMVGSTAKLQYTSTLATYRKIGSEEGICGLWKGAIPNMGRNAVVNVAEIVVYDIVKDCLLTYGKMRDNIYCHFSAAVIAGFSATVCASPVDVIKTRYMNSPKGQYTGAFDCAVRMATQEGLSAFYKGFVPAFARLVSWNVFLWITYEQIKLIVFKPKLQDEH